MIQDSYSCMPLPGECPDFNIVTVEVLESLLKEIEGVEIEPSSLEEVLTVTTSLFYQLIDMRIPSALAVGVLTVYLNKMSIMFQGLVEDACCGIVCEKEE